MKDVKLGSREREEDQASVSHYPATDQRTSTTERKRRN